MKLRRLKYPTHLNHTTQDLIIREGEGIKIKSSFKRSATWKQASIVIMIECMLLYNYNTGIAINFHQRGNFCQFHHLFLFVL